MNGARRKNASTISRTLLGIVNACSVPAKLLSDQARALPYVISDVIESISSIQDARLDSARGAIRSLFLFTASYCHCYRRHIVIASAVKKATGEAHRCRRRRRRVLMVDCSGRKSIRKRVLSAAIRRSDGVPSSSIGRK